MYVYLIQSGEGKDAPVKIGLAKSITKRMETLQIGNPSELFLLAAIPTNSRAHAYSLEKRLHKSFNSNRIRGEWFLNINMKMFENLCVPQPPQKNTKKPRKKEKQSIKRAIEKLQV